MKRKLFMIAAASAFLMLASAAVLAQSYVYEGEDYSLEFPSEHWKHVGHDEFQCDDYGHLRIQKKSVDAKVSLEDFARDQREQNLYSLPGFVSGRQETFAGRLKGIVANFEFLKNRRESIGRYYYLQADEETVYILQFEGVRAFERYQNQMDLIARSFEPHD